MGMRPAYKQTSAGLIPADWVLRQVGDFTTFVASGKSSASSKSGDFPVHGSTGIIGQCITGDYDGNAILIARVGANAGKLTVVNGKYGVTDNTIIVKIDESLHHGFFWRQLEAKRLNSMAFGSGQPLITGTQIKNLFISVPPTKAEQNAIAEALSDADALIESLEQLLTKKRRIKIGAEQCLLTGKMRVSGFNGKWEGKKLGEIGTFLKGNGVRKDESLSGNIACIRYGEIYTKHDDVIRIISSWISPEVAATATRLKSGDLLFSGSGETKEDIGKCVAFVENFEIYAGGDIIILRTAGACASALFFGYYLNTTLIKQQKASRGQGDAVVHIGAKSLAEIEIVVPPLDEQIAIGSILWDMDAELVGLAAKLSKVQQLKQAMMQELLTGKTRLI
jgi:type I restriction enzyme S subunit